MPAEMLEWNHEGPGFDFFLNCIHLKPLPDRIDHYFFNQKFTLYSSGPYSGV